jgi:signal transduction histidine kinase
VATEITAARPPPRDVAVALGATALQVAATLAAAHHNVSTRRAPDALAITLLAAGPLSLVIRRRHPVAVLSFVWATTLAYWVIGYRRGPIFLGLIIGLFSAVMSGHRRAAVTSLVLGYLAFLWLPPLVGRDRSPTLAASLGLAAWLGILYSVSELVRTRRERAREMAHTLEEEARRRASEERLAIAREVHDILAHSISLINVQAGSALHVIDEQPDRARQALSTIKDVSKEALTELRSVLGALRQDGEEAPRSPTAGLARLDDLVERARAGGLAVELEVTGRRAPLPAGVDLAAFRIVQEALTNVTRHAAARRVTVRLVYGDGDLVVQVDDDGTGDTTSANGGSGIAGMRERAAALGGSLQAAPRTGGGFRVRAWLPLEPAR